MIIKKKPLTPPEDTKEAVKYFIDNDKLDRIKNVEVLKQLIASIDEPFVMSVDSSWGTGKTTFVKMLKAHLEVDEYTCLYFNAWETDFTDDPLISFIGEMSDKLAKEAGDELKGKIEALKKSAAGIIKHVVPLITKIMISYIAPFIKTDNFDFSGFLEKHKDNFSEVIGNISKERLNLYQNEKQTIENFKTELQDLLKSLPAYIEDEKPLIFFIDELDRCKPTYAVMLLERLKHLFNVEGVVFIISTDKEQLSHSIKSLYGNDFDAKGYLRRFFDMDYTLPSPTPEKYCRYLFDHFQLDSIFNERLEYGQEEKQAIITTLVHYIFRFKLGLRDIEQLFTKISLILRTLKLNDNFIDYSYFMISLLILKEQNPPMFNKYKNKNIEWEEINKYLFNEHSEAFFNLYLYHNLKNIFKYSLKKEEDVPLIYSEKQKELKEIKHIYNIKPLEHNKRKMDEIEHEVEFLQRLNASRVETLVENTINKMELLDNFIINK